MCRMNYQRFYPCTCTSLDFLALLDMTTEELQNFFREKVSWDILEEIDRKNISGYVMKNATHAGLTGMLGFSKDDARTLLEARDRASAPTAAPSPRSQEAVSVSPTPPAPAPKKLLKPRPFWTKVGHQRWR